MTPGGNGSATATTTVNVSVPFAGTVRPLQATSPAACTPPLSADTNAVFGSSSSVTPKSVASPIPPLNQVSNTEAIGLVLYTKYVYFFELAGMVLLVSMIGAIVLTLHHRARVHRQNISVQNARTAKAAVELRKVRPGQGVDA